MTGNPRINAFNAWVYQHSMADMSLADAFQAGWAAAQSMSRRADHERPDSPSPTVEGYVRCMDCRCGGYGCSGMPPGYEARMMENW